MTTDYIEKFIVSTIHLVETFFIHILHIHIVRLSIDYYLLYLFCIVCLDISNIKLQLLKLNFYINMDQVLIYIEILLILQLILNSGYDYQIH